MKCQNKESNVKNIGGISNCMSAKLRTASDSDLGNRKERLPYFRIIHIKRGMIILSLEAIRIETHFDRPSGVIEARDL